MLLVMNIIIYLFAHFFEKERREFLNVDKKSINLFQMRSILNCDNHKNVKNLYKFLNVVNETLKPEQKEKVDLVYRPVTATRCGRAVKLPLKFT